ncbi:DNA methyltransferase [uncultured Treponema sp.]|uniref:DNA methyltransferase n=1 Tax=uncultured Treponema sp. TaxID=162155 RepID=UPI0025913361|nr:DNA methyltransferase [uncultured Treponema sp.]
MIEIRCSTNDTLNLSEITEFQGNLKERDSTDYEKIERSIRKHGFSFPFFIWRHDGVNHCLDGHYWEGRRDLSTVFDETRGDWKKMSKEQLIAELKRFDSEVKTSIIYEDKPSRSEAHPTMKPVRLFERLIMNSSKAEDIVLDPFGGSGTTIIAAAKTNRIARVMELDPHYCDVIRKRWTAWAKENGKEVGSGGLQ